MAPAWGTEHMVALGQLDSSDSSELGSWARVLLLLQQLLLCPTGARITTHAVPQDETGLEPCWNLEVGKGQWWWWGRQQLRT